MNPLKAGLSLAGALLILAGGFWGWNAYRDRQLERRAVAEADAKREAEVVASLKAELAAARAEAGRVDTLVRSVLAKPPTARPVTPADTILRSLGTDSLVALVGVLEAYSDTLTTENTTLRAVLDTTARALTRFQLVADSAIGAQARQIKAMQIVIDTPKPRRRWGLGGACGYGVVASGSSGASCTVGLAFSF